MHPEYSYTRKKTMVIGSASITIGVLGGLVPFLPGTIFVLLGLSLLSLQSKFAFQALTLVRARYPNLTNSVKKMEMKLSDFFCLTTHNRTYANIKNQNGNSISLLIEETHLDAGVAILLHSASGVSTGKVMETLAESFKMKGFTVVRFNAYHGLGDSGGDFSHFTTSAYRSDFESVLMWAKEQPWWRTPLVLCGHSVGGLVAGLYAEEHPNEVDELVLLAPTISGESYEQAFLHTSPVEYESWKETGSRNIHHPLTKENFSLSYTFVEDLKQYNLFTHSTNLTMPVTIIGSDTDTVAPLTQAHDMCKAIGKHATLITLHDIPHTPNTIEEMTELRKGLSSVVLKNKTFKS
jgi:alpha-beta hydrolase superfamily lysophospholipase